MKKIFFDTWGWIAIAHKNDDHHEKISEFYKASILTGCIPITTDYVLAETITLLRAKTEPKGVIIFMDNILEATKNNMIILERVDEVRWEKAWQLSKKYSDKPEISFFDLSSFIVMKELRITEVLTNDLHFEQAGFKGVRQLLSQRL